MHRMPFDVLHFPESSTMVVLGSLDETHVEAFRLSIAQASAGHTHDLTVDVTDVEFMPSLAVGVLVGATKHFKAEGANLQLVAREGTIGRRVLELCGFPVTDPATDGAELDLN